METWFEIWGHNLITTSNLVLNRAWLARLPIVQTGNDFINLNSLDWALELHQFPSDPCAIACKNNDLPLLERLFSLGFTTSDKAFKYGFSFGSIAMIEQLMKDLKPFRVLYYLKRPAKLGRLDVIEWAIEHGHIEHSLALGAAKHSADLLRKVFELAPQLRVRSVELTAAALASDAIKFLFEEKLTAADPCQYRRAIKYNRLALFEKLINLLGVQPGIECSWAAATRGLEVLQRVSKYVAPDKRTLLLAAKAGDKESVLWLQDKCNGKTAWDGASQHSIEMLNFVVHEGFPKSDFAPFNQMHKPIKFKVTLEIVQWAERNGYSVSYNDILCDALMDFQPKLVHHIREKTQLEDWHLKGALIAKNFVQAQWLLDHQCPSESVLELLYDTFDLETWKFAHDRGLYDVPIEQPRWFEENAPQVLEWLRETGQLKT